VHKTAYADKTVLDYCLQVLVHWACQKISASLQQPDDQLKDMLTGKLQKYRGIRYSLIAGHAESVGRKGLATLLLEYETCAADQVHLFPCIKSSSEHPYISRQGIQAVAPS